MRASQLPPEPRQIAGHQKAQAWVESGVKLTRQTGGPLACSFSLEAGGPPSEASSPPQGGVEGIGVCIRERGSDWATTWNLFTSPSHSIP